MVTLNSLCLLNTSHTPSEINYCTSHDSIISPQKSEAAIWQSFFSSSSSSWCGKPAKAALLTGSLAEYGLATKDVFHPQWLRYFLQEASTFPYLASDKALCHSTVYHNPSLRIQGFFPLKWRAFSAAAPNIYSNKIPVYYLCRKVHVDHWLDLFSPKNLRSKL